MILGWQCYKDKKYSSSVPVNIPNKNSNSNTNTFPGDTRLKMQRMIDEIALQHTTSNTNNFSSYIYGIGLRQLSCFDPNAIKTCENIPVSFVKHDESEDKNKVTTDCSLFFYDLEDEVGCDSKGNSSNNFLVSENKWHSESLA